MNKVVHFEIPAKDMNRAKKFYEEVFSWKINAFDKKYFIANTVATDEKTMRPKEPGAINGGIMEWMAEAPSTVIVIAVDDLDAHLKKIEKAGGIVVMPKMKVEDMLWYARVKDTEGNIIGVMQAIRK